METDKITFFSLGDSRYFPGTVGLVNSLRLTGHTGEIVILDCGFTDAQRQLLSPACTLVPLSASDDASNRTYYKLVAPRAHEADLTVIIDSDIIVTDVLDEVADAAAGGKIVAHPDPERRRWFAEWEEIFQLPAAPRKDVYVCAALVAFSRHAYPDLLEQWWDACQRTRHARTVAEGASGPTSQADQDALNAVLMSRYPHGTVAVRPALEAPQARELAEGVEIVDRSTLHCAYRGHRTLLLHAAGTPKAWLLRGVRRDAYTTLLGRLLDSDDVTVRVPRRLAPPWIGTGVAARSLLASLAAAKRASRPVRRAATSAQRRVRAFTGPQGRGRGSVHP